MPDTKKESWHLDRRVPLALIVVILVQTAGIVWWAATLQAKSEAQEGRIVRLEQQNAQSTLLGERLARLEERMDGLRENTSRIERLLRALVQDSPKP